MTLCHNELHRSKLRGINGKAAIRSQQAAGNVPKEIQKYILAILKLQVYSL
jgi:hypothetical protein